MDNSGCIEMNEDETRYYTLMREYEEAVRMEKSFSKTIPWHEGSITLKYKHEAEKSEYYRSEVYDFMLDVLDWIGEHQVLAFFSLIIITMTCVALLQILMGAK